MTFVVLVKVVPALDELTFDPERWTVRREATELFANPLDARAVVAADALRSPGEDVVVLSMGPPAARAPLLEVLAQGADRAILVSDPLLSGSDAAVTSRVLARVVRTLSPEVVLCGRCSTDASTAQVPAQLAEELRWPLASEARALSRTGPKTLEAVVDTEIGWARERLTLPAVVSTSEKVAKPRKFSPAPPPPDPSRLEAWDLERVGLSREAVGDLGSPTRVIGIRSPPLERTPKIFRDRAAADLVRAAVAALRGGRQAAEPPRGGPTSAEVLVWVSPEHGGLDPHGLDLVRSSIRGRGVPGPCAIGFGPWDPGTEEALTASWASRVLWAVSPLGYRSPAALVPGLRWALRTRPPTRAVLVPSTSWGRELAGRLATRERLGLVGDAVDLRIDDVGRIVFSKPSFGGALLAEVVCRPRPAVATIRPGAMVSPGRRSPAERIPMDRWAIEDGPGRSERVEERDEHLEVFGELDRARVVVTLGMGIGDATNVARVQELVRPLHAALAGTRKVVDAGWLPVQRQVGLTGRAVAPELVLLVGTSGRINHLVGLRRAGSLLGINPDPAAPLFTSVDVGLVGRWEELLPPLVSELVRAGWAGPPGTVPTPSI